MAGLDMFSGAMPSMSGTVNTLTYVLIAFFVVVILGGGIFVYYVNKKFNKRIKLFRKAGDRVVKFAEDTGMFQKIGIEGDVWLKLRASKKILPKPRFEMSKDEFWYFERKDGEFVDFTLQDMNLAKSEAELCFVAEDMRLSRLGIGKILDAEFKKPSFWEKYGSSILAIIMMIIFIVGMIISYKHDETISKQAMATAQQIGPISEKLEKIAMALDRTVSRGYSGAIPVNESQGVKLG